MPNVEKITQHPHSTHAPERFMPRPRLMTKTFTQNPRNRNVFSGIGHCIFRFGHCRRRQYLDEPGADDGYGRPFLAPAEHGEGPRLPNPLMSTLVTLCYLSPKCTDWQEKDKHAKAAKEQILKVVKEGVQV